MCRRCGEPDKRGNARNRRQRKNWLLDPKSGHGGDGTSVACWNHAECGTTLTFTTLEVDRIIPGWRCVECYGSRHDGDHDTEAHEFRGGSYRRDNIRPSCAPCNLARNRGNPWTFGAETRCLTGAVA